MSVLAAEVWTYWISYALLGVTILLLVAYLVGYWLRVTARRRPRQ